MYAGNSIVAPIDDSNIKYYHRNRASNRLTTDSSGNLDKEFKSLPFGQKVLNSGVDYAFTGKEEDESSLYYFGARYYDDNLGRFTSVDPIAGEHSYAYVLNNPMNLVDPSGMRSVTMEDVIRFGMEHPMIAARFKMGFDINAADREIILEWFANEFKDKLPLSYRYLQMYRDPTILENASRSEWYGDEGTKRCGTLYPAYDASQDFIDAGFDTDHLLLKSAKRAKNPDKIFELYESGEEALLMVNEYGLYSPIEYEAMGIFSYYIQKGENGMATIRIKDRYDWFEEEQGPKQTVFGINGPPGETKGSSRNFGRSQIKYYRDGGAIFLEDTALDGMGQAYIVGGEWDVPEGDFYEAFGRSQ